MDDASFHSSYGIPIETQLRETQPIPRSPISLKSSRVAAPTLIVLHFLHFEIHRVVSCKKAKTSTQYPPHACEYSLCAVSAVLCAVMVPLRFTASWSLIHVVLFSTALRSSSSPSC